MRTRDIHASDACKRQGDSKVMYVGMIETDMQLLSRLGCRSTITDCVSRQPPQRVSPVHLDGPWSRIPESRGWEDCGFSRALGIRHAHGTLAVRRTEGELPLIHQLQPLPVSIVPRGQAMVRSRSSAGLASPLSGALNFKMYAPAKQHRSGVQPHSSQALREEVSSDARQPTM